MSRVKAKVIASTAGAAVAAVVAVLAASGVTAGPSVVKGISFAELAIDVVAVTFGAFAAGYAKVETVPGGKGI